MKLVYMIATGEPPLCLSVTLQHALKMAIRSARGDAGLPEEWFDLGRTS